MKVANACLLAASALLVASLSVRAHAPQVSDPRPSQILVEARHASSGADYLGSAACARCHQEAFDEWQRSLHVRMTRPIANATVVGDFSGAVRLADRSRRVDFGRSNGQPFMRVTVGGGSPETFAVEYTLGAKRYQGYLSTLSDGRIYVLPAFWHIETRRWIDWKEITPVPDEAHDLRQVWNTNCFNCHATNLAQGFDPATRRYASTWTEMGIGCEACHGPGRPHVTLMETWERDPATKPSYDNRSSNRELSAMLKTLSTRSAPPRQTYDTCAYCHGNKQNVFVGFRAGDRYEDYALPFLISAPIPTSDRQGEFWPDGRPSRFNRPQALTLSGCFKADAIACTNCHAAHGSRHPFSLKIDITQGRNGDLLCTQCHAGAGGVGGAGRAGRAGGAAGLTGALWSDEAIEAHTFHRPDSAGSRCVACHMSDVNWRLLTRRRDHTFQPPVPEVTTAFGVPNACTTCHEARAPEWAARQMDEWWRDADRRKAQTGLAATMYRAGSGDPSSLPDLARLAVDRSNGMLVRASAVEFMGQLALGKPGGSSDGMSQTSFEAAATPAGQRRSPVGLSHAQVNALIGAASDPEPTVRARAVTALLASGQRDRIITPIVARLVDTARVVRVRAAEALLALGIAALPGQAGGALARAQDEYATALGDFPDVAANHAALGWLESERNRADQATAALDRAIRLDPRAARPWVVKGVIAARGGRLADAVDLWQKARSLEPDYPNIERLIAEARKRAR
jgi:predicted CXXCH cytochrome family protein